MKSKLLATIESKRGTKNPFFAFLVVIKDVIWLLVIFIPKLLLDRLILFVTDSVFFLRIIFGVYRKKVPAYYRISMCITCMDRIEHLKKTLRKNINNNAAYPQLEFILLDYNSNDGLQEWVFKEFEEEISSGKLVYYQTKTPQFFEMARAKNIAHELTTGDAVVNLDADNYTGRDFAFYVNSRLQSNPKIVGVGDLPQRYSFKVGDCGGRIFLLKIFFQELGGYDERFLGYGCEDTDFRLRASDRGLLQEVIPHYFLKSVRHDNYLREKKMSISVDQSLRLNHLLLKKRQKHEVRVSNRPIDFNDIRKII